MKYGESESVTLEFKRQLPSSLQIAKTIVGFCNRFGGKLIIGVDDKQNICGVAEVDIDDQIESLQQSIYRSCTPTVLPSIYTQRIHDKLILIIEVSSGMNKPYFVTALGLNDGTFIRAGAHTVKANSVMLQELIWKGKGYAADEMPVYSATQQDIDKEKFIAFLSEYRGHHQQSHVNDQLIHYKIMIEEHQRNYPTLGGMLLFGKIAQKFIPEAFIICSHFQGVEGREVIATLDCTGDLFTQLNTAIGFVISRLNKQFIITKLKRQQALEIPEIALREIIINAIVHRDYYLPAPIKIAIYDDRVEIFSPGNFPGPLKSNQLETGVTYIRNHVICKLFREAGYIEKLGSGFLTLFDSYRKNHLPIPQVIEGAGFVKCILPRRTVHAPLYPVNDIKNEIMHLFYGSNEISSKEVAEKFNISRQTAARRLSELVAKGALKIIGKGPALRYKKNR